MSTSLEDKLNLIYSEKTNKIVPGNILNGVNIFNVVGTVIESNEETGVVVEPLITSQTIEPNSGYTGLANITINAVTSNIDVNIMENTILNGVSILGVTGNVSFTSFNDYDNCMNIANDILGL